MNAVGLIPARMASTRFPGKPMARIRGIPMVEHVYWRTILSSLADAWVCTCDLELHEYMNSIGGKSVMTSDRHERASDRIAEAMAKIEQSAGVRIDLAVLVQGDEPMIVPSMLDELVAPARAGVDADVFNLMERIDSDEEFEDPNCVKVVVDAFSNALYLSREPIPSRKKYDGHPPRWKQLGLIAFRREALVEYARLAPTPLEVIESVDVNRLLEHGRRLRMIPTDCRTQAVDTPEDLALVEALMKDDPLVQSYPRPEATR